MTNNSEAILKTLKRGPKKGLTAQNIAERAGLKLSSTRTELWALRSAGDVELAGTSKTTSTAGRPAYLYVIS